jgi:uncharacterized membrane protein YqgA involved in biofilm formation
MTGTLINAVAVIVGGMVGLIFGARFPDRIRETTVMGLGLFTAGIGILLFLDTQNPLVVLGSLLIGGILGELWKIETGLKNLGLYFERRFSKDQTTTSKTNSLDSSIFTQSVGERDFVRGFLTSSLVFCVGPMTILGSIQDGLTGNYELLAIKSLLDGFAALAFASTFGIGVLFSVLTILIYQGGISLLAVQAQVFLTETMMVEMTAVGGLLLLGLSISSLLEIRPIRVGNFLPALGIAPLIVWLLEFLRIV